MKTIIRGVQVLMILLASARAQQETWEDEEAARAVLEADEDVHDDQSSGANHTPQLWRITSSLFSSSTRTGRIEPIMRVVHSHDGLRWPLRPALDIRYDRRRSQRPFGYLRLDESSSDTRVVVGTFDVLVGLPFMDKGRRVSPTSAITGPHGTGAQESIRGGVSALYDESMPEGVFVSHSLGAFRFWARVKKTGFQETSKAIGVVLPLTNTTGMHMACEPRNGASSDRLMIDLVARNSSLTEIRFASVAGQDRRPSAFATLSTSPHSQMQIWMGSRSFQSLADAGSRVPSRFGGRTPERGGWMGWSMRPSERLHIVIATDHFEWKDSQSTDPWKSGSTGVFSIERRMISRMTIEGSFRIEQRESEQSSLMVVSIRQQPIPEVLVTSSISRKSEVTAGSRSTGCLVRLGCSYRATAGGVSASLALCRAADGVGFWSVDQGIPGLSGIRMLAGESALCVINGWIQVGSSLSIKMTSRMNENAAIKAVTGGAEIEFRL